MELLPQFNNIIVAIISGIVGPSTILILNYYLNKRKKPDVVKEAIELGEPILEKLEHIKSSYGADRIWIAQFHNGGNFYPTGKSIAKFSVIYESLELNTPAIQKILQNTPINLYAKTVQSLYKTGVISIYDTKDPLIDKHGLEGISEASGTKSTYVFPIKDFDDVFIGFLGVDFVKSKVMLTENSISDIKLSVAGIGVMLMNHLIKK